MQEERNRIFVVNWKGNVPWPCQDQQHARSSDQHVRAFDQHVRASDQHVRESDQHVHASHQHVRANAFLFYDQYVCVSKRIGWLATYGK